MRIRIRIIHLNMCLKITTPFYHLELFLQPRGHSYLPSNTRKLSLYNLNPKYVNARQIVTSLKIITFEKPLKSILLSISPPADIATHKLKFRQGKIRDPRKSKSPEFSHPPPLLAGTKLRWGEGGGAKEIYQGWTSLFLSRYHTISMDRGQCQWIIYSLLAFSEEI